MAERDIATWNDLNFFNICSDGDLETLRIYLRKLSRTDISAIRDPHGATLAHHAARYGHVHILRYFVEEKHLDLTQLQTEHRASCAHDAAVCDQVEAMKYLLHYRHETNSSLRWNFRDDHGNTTLHLGRKRKENVFDFVFFLFAFSGTIRFDQCFTIFVRSRIG